MENAIRQLLKDLHRHVLYLSFVVGRLAERTHDAAQVALVRNVHLQVDGTDFHQAVDFSRPDSRDQVIIAAESLADRIYMICDLLFRGFTQMEHPVGASHLVADGQYDLSIFMGVFQPIPDGRSIRCRPSPFLDLMRCWIP